VITAVHTLVHADDADATVAELREKGVQFTSEIRDEAFGRTITFRVPGAGDMLLYQATHPTAHDL
jgi:hypothetical protein